MGLGGFAAGFAKGLAGSIHENEVRKRELEAKQKQLASEMLLKHGLENPGVADTPEFQTMLGEQFGKQAPAIQKVFEFAKASQPPSLMSLLGGEGAPAEAAPAAAEPAAAIPGIGAPAPMTEAGLGAPPVNVGVTPPLGAVPPAPAPTAAPTPGASPLSRLQAKLPEGVRVPVKTSSGTIYVTGQNQKEANERAYWHAYLERRTAYETQGLNRADAGMLAHEQTAQEFITQERNVPKEARTFLDADSEALRKGLLVRTETQARKEVERQFREEAAGVVPGTPGSLIEAEAGARARGGKRGTASAEESLPIPTKEVGRWFDTKTGKPLAANTPLGTARRTGVLVTPKQLDAAMILDGLPQQYLHELDGVINVLFKTNKPEKAFVNAIRYRANLALRAPGPETEAAVKLQEARNNIIGFLRQAFGERGNFAARLADKALESFVQYRETKDTARARYNFMKGIVAATRKATGVPLTPEQEKFYRAIDENAKRIPGITETFGNAIGAQITAYPGPETAHAATDAPPPSAADEFNSLLGEAGLGTP